MCSRIYKITSVCFKGECHGIAHFASNRVSPFIGQSEATLSFVREIYTYA